MLKQTFLNVAFTGFAQAVSLVVILALAGVLEAQAFGVLSIQLSAAAVLSIIITFQFERVYVRVKNRALANYIAFHLRSLVLISVVMLGLSLPFTTGPSAVILGAAIGFAQIALYAAARQGHFRRIWLMKGIQAASLLLFSGLIYLSDRSGPYWLAFLGSYSCAGVMALDGATRGALFATSLRNDLRRFRYSVSIARVALGSLLTVSFTREFPVLLAGAMGQPDTAGTIGLVMRAVGSPVGLLARSASAVVAGYVASRRFNISTMKKLLIIPSIGIFHVALVGLLASLSSLFETFNNFSVYLIAITPFFLIQGYVGLLGSAIIFYKIQRDELLCNIAIAAAALIAGGAAYFDVVNFTTLLWLMSCISVILGAYIASQLVKKLGECEHYGHH